MISQLEKRLNRYSKEHIKNDNEHERGNIAEEEFQRKKFDIQRKIVAVYDLQKKRIKDQEFSDSIHNLTYGLMIDSHAGKAGMRI